MEIKIFEAFAGYGSQSMALERLKEANPNFNYEIVGISEIDPDAIKAYNITHNPGITNYGDITKIDWVNVPDFDLFTYSFPCTDISNIGKGEGFKEGSGTRSSLLWECKKAITLKKPKYLLMENVKALINKKNKADFEKWENYLSGLGYTNYWKVLNAKDYNIPQSRERVFMVSILGDHKPFQFPPTITLTKKFKDILDNNIPDDVWIKPDDKGVYSRKRINEMLANGKITLKKLQWVDLYSQLTYDDCVTTITTRVFGASNHLITNVTGIRRPTKREVFRLMGVNETNIDKLLTLNLNRDKFYIMAGNSIVVDVMFYLFQNLFN